MPKVFVLPKESELTVLNLTDKFKDGHFQSNNMIILNPKIVVAMDEDGFNKGDTISNINGKIEEIKMNDNECYLLYHIGNGLTLNEELIKEISFLTHQKYSSSDASYEKVKIDIRKIVSSEIDENYFIRTYFFDKELETKLELLHNCLTSEEAKNISNESLDLIKDTIMPSESELLVINEIAPTTSSSEPESLEVKTGEAVPVQRFVKLFTSATITEADRFASLTKLRDTFLEQY